jgi:hypothetical protein
MRACSIDRVFYRLAINKLSGAGTASVDFRGCTSLYLNVEADVASHRPKRVADAASRETVSR